MTDLRFSAKKAENTEIPRPKRGEGQWALGYTEPLNKNEQSKKDDDPLNVRDRILYIYSKRGFASIDPADLRGRFRWLGLYTQRAPGFDGGKTAMLEEEELDDEFFMMRVRSDGALLSADAVRALGEIGRDYARDTADVTDRENIQYHWIRVEDVPAIWAKLDAAGLDTMEACGDSPRPFLGSPVAGVSVEEIIDGSSALAEIKRRYVGDPEFSNLPRKFKTALTGHPSHDVSPETHDIAFVGTLHPEHGPGFDLWVGGGLSTNPMLAQKAGVWIPTEDVPDVWAGVASIFRDYGYRRLRSRARLKFLVADWGVEKFREVLENEYLGRKLVTCESPASPVGHRDHVGVHPQKDGKNYIGVAPVAGRISGTVLIDLADLIERHGIAGARLTPYQKIVLIGVDPAVDRAGRHRARKHRAAGPALQLASEHDGLHGHRVLQARHRRDQGPRARPGRRARTPLPGPGGADHRQRQRMPQRLRPDPGRRHRPQGPARAARGRAGRRLPGAPRWCDRPPGQLRPQAARAQGDQRRSRRLRDHRGLQLPGRPAGRRVVRDLGGPGRRGAAPRRIKPGVSALMTERGFPVHCPYCGEQDLWPHSEAHGSWECRGCLRAFSLKMLGLVRPQSVGQPPASGSVQ